MIEERALQRLKVLQIIVKEVTCHYASVLLVRVWIGDDGGQKICEGKREQDRKGK